MSRLYFVLATALLFATACTSPKLLIDANQANLRQARLVATTFYHDYGKHANLKDVPFVTVGTEGGPGFSYDVPHNVLFVTPYEFADFDTQKFFGRASLQADGKEAYNSLMFEFFTAHQLMHLLYDELPLHAASHYDEEMHINTMTWLYLRTNGLSVDHEAAWLTTLANLEANLGRRFPEASADPSTVRDIEVLSNAAYWYVTAVGMQQAYRKAQDYPTTTDYISELILLPAGGEASAAR